MDEPVPIFVPRSRAVRRLALGHREGWRRAWASVSPRPWVRTVLGLVLFEVAFFFAYRLGMAFPQDRPAPFWFPDTILLCALLLSPPARWWMLVAATLPVRLFTASPPELPGWFLLATFAIDSGKAVLAAAGLRHLLGPRPRLGTTRDFTRYLLVAVAIVPALAALAGASARAAMGYPFGPNWLQWFVGNAMTHLVVTPAVLWACLELPGGKETSDKRALEGGILAVGLVLLAWIGFRSGPAMAGPAELCRYLLVPFLFWAALRFGMLGASGAVLVLLWVSVQASFEGTGPFFGQTPAGAATILHEFLFLGVAPLYFVAIAGERERGARRFLEQSEERFREVANSAPMMIWMSGPGGARTYFNPRWAAFTGRQPEMEAGDGWIAGVHPQDRLQIDLGRRAVSESHRRFILEYRLRRHDGQYLWVRDQAVPCATADGEFLGYVGSCVDLAARNRSEAEAGAERRVDPMDLAHAGRVSALGQLASSLAHELNQPLGAILRNAEAAELILKDGPMDHNEVLAILADIRRDDHRAGAVIDHMRSLLKRREIELEPLSALGLIDHVLVLLRVEMQARRVTIERDVPAPLPLVWGDHVHLEQVLLNLLVNGADAIEGTGSAPRRLDIRARLVDPFTVSVSVADTGPGIPEERMKRLFEPFYTTKPGGLGMGLAIAKVIIESHGGRIWAANGPDGGAVVSFTLRVATQEDE
jgi:PAS domain S-box-containing protein